MKRPTKAMIKTIRRGKVCSSSFKISYRCIIPPSILHPPPFPPFLSSYLVLHTLCAQILTPRLVVGMYKR